MARHESMRAHHGRCAWSTGRTSERRTARVDEARPRREHDVHDLAARLLKSVSVLIPAPTAGLATDDASWRAFDDLLDEAAEFVVRTLGSDHAHAVRSLAGEPWTEDPVHAALVVRAWARLEAGQV